MAARPSPRFSIIEVAQRQASRRRRFRARSTSPRSCIRTRWPISAASPSARAFPNRVGRSLRSGSTRTIGLILPTLSNPVFAECFEGAERRARESGYSVMLTATGYDPAESAAVQA